MFKWALLLSAVVLQSACSSRTEQAQETLKSFLGEKVYLEFQNVEAFPGGAVCGEYRSNDPMRGSSRYSRFVVWGDRATDKPSKQDWAIFCTEDAAAALVARLGIGPVSDEDNHLVQLRTDLHQLQSALQQYRADNSILPTPEQGLAALAAAPTVAPLPRKYRDDGYIEALRDDPWGRPYIYDNSGLGGGVIQQFDIYTLGADGAPGGKGKNADVRLAHLKYLDYLMQD